MRFSKNFIKILNVFLGGSTSVTHQQIDQSKIDKLPSTIGYIGSRRILVFPIILTKSDIEDTMDSII